MTRIEKTINQMSEVTRSMLKKRMDSNSHFIRQQMRLPKKDRDQRKIDALKQRNMTIKRWLKDN
jgi:hypothetical protein